MYIEGFQNATLYFTHISIKQKKTQKVHLSLLVTFVKDFFLTSLNTYIVFVIYIYFMIHI